MPLEVSYSEARANLASILDHVTDDCEVVTIRRRGHEDVALISASELSSMLETEYLFRSPKNAERLTRAIERTIAGEGEKISIEELRKDFGAERSKKK